MIDRRSLPLMLALVLAATPVLAQSGAGTPPPTPPIPPTPAIPGKPAAPAKTAAEKPTAGKPAAPNPLAIPPTPAVPGAPGAPPPTPPIPAAQKVSLSEIEKRLPEHVFGMKRLKMEQKADGKGGILQALYQGQAGRATLLVDARNEAALPDGATGPQIEKAVEAALVEDVKQRVAALGERYWQSEPFMKRLEEKRTGMSVLCGLIERRANTQEKTPDQIRMRSAACATGAGGRLLILRITTPYKGALEADAQKVQEYFVMAIAQAVAGQVKAERR